MMQARPSRRLPGAVLAASLLLPGGAAATITDCPASGGFKVYLDEPSVAGDRAPDVEFLLNELLFLFDERKEREWVEWLPSGNAGTVAFVKCPDRQPSIDGSDFDPALVDLLYNEDVLVELVANLRAGDNGDIVAFVSFIVVPVRQMHFEESVAPDGLFRDRLTSSGGQADFVELFRSVRHLDHYVAAGLGIKAARRGDYEAAQGGLCRSLAALNAQQSPALVQLLSALAAENLRAAKSDVSYDGPLLVLDPTRPCPESPP